MDGSANQYLEHEVCQGVRYNWAFVPITFAAGTANRITQTLAKRTTVSAPSLSLAQDGKVYCPCIVPQSTANASDRNGSHIPGRCGARHELADKLQTQAAPGAFKPASIVFRSRDRMRPPKSGTAAQQESRAKRRLVRLRKSPVRVCKRPSPPECRPRQCTKGRLGRLAASGPPRANSRPGTPSPLQPLRVGSGN